MKRTLCNFALVLLFLNPFDASANATHSDLENLARDFFSTLNTKNSQQISEFVNRHFSQTGSNKPSTSVRVERFLGLMSNAGRLLVNQLVVDGDKVVATVQFERTEVWRTVTLNFDSTSSHRIVSIGLSVTTSPNLPAHRPSDMKIVTDLTDFATRLAKRDVFSGALLIAKNGKPLVRLAFGEANKDFRIANTVETKFNLGSMNKMFTAVAIMQLCESGKLELNVPIGKYLPAGTLRNEVLRQVNIAHLLTHTAGLGDYFTDTWDTQSRALYREIDDWMGLIKNENLKFMPGTDWSYSNTGMLVLGKIIESASGQNYFDYVRENITKPLGMSNTDSYTLDEVNTNLAIGYEANRKAQVTTYRNNIFTHIMRGGPAGGGYSTVDDLLKFSEAIQTEKLLKTESVRLMISAKPEMQSPEYGFGFSVLENGRIVGHSGGFAGISTQLDIYPNEGYTVVVLSNYSDGSEALVEMIRSLLLLKK